MELTLYIIVVAFLLLLLVGLIGYARMGGRPAGPPEPVTGARAMERKVALTLALLLAMGGLFTLYGFPFEGQRLVVASEQQQNITIRRGIETYASLCYTCHGENGRGAIVPDTDPPIVAPPLNRPDFQPTDPDEYQETYEFIFRTIARGRPGTPMPAWEIDEGGTLLEEYIHELTAMILNGQKQIAMRHELVEGGVFAPILPNEGRVATVWEHAEEVVEERIAHGAPTPIPVPVGELVGVELSPEAEAGLSLWRGEAACIGCHQIAGIGGGTSGPPLSNIATVAATRRPGVSAEEYIRESILQPNAFVVEGFQPIMPSYEGRLTEEQLNNLVQFYLTLE